MFWLHLAVMPKGATTQAAFLASGGVASLAALLQQRREPAIVAVALEALTAFVRAAVAAAAGAGGRNGSEPAAAVAPDCGRARSGPVASPSNAGPAVPSDSHATEAGANAGTGDGGVPSRAAAQLRSPNLPLMLALDDGLVAAVVVTLRRRAPDGGVEPDLALPALHLLSCIVTAKASARQLLRCRPAPA